MSRWRSFGQSLAVSSRPKNHAAHRAVRGARRCHADGGAKSTGSPDGMLKTKVPEAGAPEAGCQLARCPAGVTYSTRAKSCTCGVPIKAHFCRLFCHCSLSLCPVTLEAPCHLEPAATAVSRFRQRFSTARRFLTSGFQPEAAIEACRRPKSTRRIQAADWFVMAASAFLSCKSLDPAEDFVVDLDTPISETILNFGPLHHTKQLLADNSQTVSPRLCSNLS